MVWPKILKINNRKTRLILSNFGFEVDPGCNMGRCAVLATWHRVSPQAFMANLVLYHRASLSGLSELLLRLRTTVTPLFQATRGKRRLLSFLSLSELLLCKQCSFQNEVASILPDIGNKSQHPWSQLLGPFWNSPIIRVLPVLSSTWDLWSLVLASYFVWKYVLL